jgi:hypothetical protein
MRQGYGTISPINKKSPPPREGREAEAYMRNGFTAGFCHFLGREKKIYVLNFVEKNRD